jgi:3-deoxy-7-phosphoheptulonate synthase
MAQRLICSTMRCAGTDGGVQVALDAIKAASNPHQFLSVSKQGLTAIVRTLGNPSCHVILRGGKQVTHTRAR